MQGDWQTIDSAPRDGTVIWVADLVDHVIAPVLMWWNARGFNRLVSRSEGIWEDVGGEFTWCEDDGVGPTHWRPRDHDAETDQIIAASEPASTPPQPQRASA